MDYCRLPGTIQVTSDHQEHLRLYALTSSPPTSLLASSLVELQAARLKRAIKSRVNLVDLENFMASPKRYLVEVCVQTVFLQFLSAITIC